MEINDHAIEMLNITKEFPGIKANDDITFNVKKGEVHALMGENGAGKSTLMSILFGIYTPTSGEIKVNGKKVSISSPQVASSLGIGMVHQHFKLIDIFSALDNIVLGYEIKNNILLSLIRTYYDINKSFIDEWYSLSTERYIKSYKENVEFNTLYNDLIKLKKIRTKTISKQIMKIYHKINFLKQLESLLNVHIRTSNWFITVFNKLFKKDKQHLKEKLFFEEKINGFKTFSIQNLDLKSIDEKIEATKNKITATKKSENKMAAAHSVNKLYSLENKVILKNKKLAKFKSIKETETFVDKSIAFKNISNISEKYNLNVDLNLKIENMSVGMQQRVEIIKMLYRENDILILDEPTSVLSPKEIDGLLENIIKFKELGKTVILITHKLNEIKAVADRCTIIRKGKTVGTFNVKTTSSEKLAELMVGSKRIEQIKKINLNSTRSNLSLRNLQLSKGGGKIKILKDINFDVKAGEIFGIAGVEGNGQSELSMVISGLLKASSGSIMCTTAHDLKVKFDGDSANKINKLKQILEEFPESSIRWTRWSIAQDKDSWEEITKGKGNQILHSNMTDSVAQKVIELIESKKVKLVNLKFEDISHMSIKQRYVQGMAYIPEDRHKEGLIIDMNLEQNVLLKDFSNEPFSKFGFINQGQAVKFANSIITDYDIRVGQQGAKSQVRSMSGGNQQKIIIGREVSSDPNLIVAIQPCRGLDVGAIDLIHQTFIKERNKGRSVLLISYELDEILKISDRIGVMHNGEILGILSNKEATKEKIGLMMAGVKNHV